MSKRRQWSLLTVVSVLAVLAAGWFMFVAPKRAQAASLRAQAVTQSQANGTLRAQVAALTLQARNLPRQRARLALLAAKIPNDPALPTLIVRLREAADRAGVTLVSLAPGPPLAVTATAAAGVPAPTGSAAAAGTPQLLAIPIAVQVTGGFFQLEQLLTNLEDLPRSFLVGGLTVAPGATPGVAAPGASAGLSGGSLSATINGRVFVTAVRPAAPAPVMPSTAAG
jgi:Tfp pilus assembly protein PilO